jgi:hypothetical protein
MECLLYVLVETSSLELRDQVELNLSVDKPVLEEDVEPQWQSLFSALEFLPLPDQVCQFDKCRLLIAWAIDFSTEPSYFINPLVSAGLKVLGALEAFEDGGYCLVSIDDASLKAARSNKCREEQVFFSPNRVASILMA